MVKLSRRVWMPNRRVVSASLRRMIMNWVIYVGWSPLVAPISEYRILIRMEIGCGL